MVGRLVKVVWDDAEDPADGKTWLDAEDVETFAAKSCTVESVGWLMSKTAKYITLAADRIDGLGHCGRVTKIPRGMALEVEDLGVIGRTKTEAAGDVLGESNGGASRPEAEVLRRQGEGPAGQPRQKARRSRRRSAA